jgi:hypothetical protein
VRDRLLSLGERQMTVHDEPAQVGQVEIEFVPVTELPDD